MSQLISVFPEPHMVHVKTSKFDVQSSLQVYFQALSSLRLPIKQLEDNAHEPYMPSYLWTTSYIHHGNIASIMYAVVGNVSKTQLNPGASLLLVVFQPM